ncbi:MAG: hypothetical protein QF521_15280 [Alphaproteobacteria bacterium]|jgi:hypothetical protein|nr:hypothetical protein [Alphaproteobacteria bacterium]
MSTTTALNLSRGRIEVFLIIGVAIFFVLGSLMEVSYYILEHKRLLGFLRQFSLSEEANIPTWYSAMLLMSCAVCLALITCTQDAKENGYRRHWLILCLIFVYISMDETSVIHEMTIKPLRYGFDLTGIFHYSWVIPAAGLMAIFLISYIGFLRHLRASSRNRFIIAGLVYVGGAFGTELIIGYHWTTVGEGIVSGMLNVTQESMEMCGSSLFLSALLRHLEAVSPRFSLALEP